MIESSKLVSQLSKLGQRAGAFDVIIIGGGIMGCCTAFELAKRGISTAIVEKGTIGDGPSGKSSAIIRQHYSNELTARMALYSLGVFQNFETLFGGECGFTKTGFLLMVDAKDEAGLRSNVAFQQGLGINTGIISKEDAKELLPSLEMTDLVAMAYEPDSGYADPYLTVNAYAQAARRHGALIYQENRVLEVLFKGGRVAGVRTQEGKLDAPVVINCGGAWGAQIARMAEISAPINACRVQVAFFRRPSGQEPSHPVIADFVNSTYFRSETGGITLVGLIDPEEANAIVDPDSYREYMDDTFLLEAGERLVRRYPAMEFGQSAGGYASLYAITPDWHPIVDEVPRGSGFFLCSGFSGHGFKLGPAVGLMVSDMVLGVSTPRFDPRLLRFDRFEQDDPVSGGYTYGIVG
ncbi:MAG: NAD(P)/FAD-dependent oxidoreductase [Candidatus Promineifilaceae bacterium]